MRLDRLFESYQDELFKLFVMMHVFNYHVGVFLVENNDLFAWVLH